jgi:hypothetical protein
MFLMYRAIRVTVRKLPLGLPGGRGGWVPHVLLLRKVLSLRMRLACTLCGGRWYSSPIRLTSSLTHNCTNQVSSSFWQTRYPPWGWIFVSSHTRGWMTSFLPCFHVFLVWPFGFTRYTCQLIFSSQGRPRSGRQACRGVWGSPVMDTLTGPAHIIKTPISGPSLVLIHWR